MIQTQRPPIFRTVGELPWVEEPEWMRRLRGLPERFRDYVNQVIPFPFGFYSAGGVKAYVGNFQTTTNAAGNTVAVTGVGFTPKLIIFFNQAETGTGDALGNSDTMSLGWALENLNRTAFSIYAVQGGTGAGSDWVGAQRQDACVMVLNSGAATINGLMDITSMDGDGFTMTIDDQFSASFNVNFLALGGEIEGEQGTITVPGATGNQTITGHSFEPKGVIIAGLGSTNPNVSMPDIDNNASGYTIGGATGPTNEGVIYWGSQGAFPTVASGYSQSNDIVAQSSNLGALTLNQRAEFIAFTADGFTINWIERTASTVIAYLVINTDKIYFGNFSSRADLNNIVVTGVGFEPVGLLLFSSNRAQNTRDAATATALGTIGATDGTRRKTVASLQRNGIAGSIVAYHGQRTAQMYGRMQDGGSATWDGYMDIVSLDADGFTAVMDDADPSAAQVFFMAFG